MEARYFRAERHLDPRQEPEVVSDQPRALQTSHAIAQTCREISQVAGPLHFALNTSKVYNLAPYNVDIFGKWLRAIELQNFKALVCFAVMPPLYNTDEGLDCWIGLVGDYDLARAFTSSPDSGRQYKYMTEDYKDARERLSNPETYYVGKLWTLALKHGCSPSFDLEIHSICNCLEGAFARRYGTRNSVARACKAYDL